MQIIPLMHPEVQKYRMETMIIRMAMTEYRFYLQKYSCSNACPENTC